MNERRSFPAASRDINWVAVLIRREVLLGLTLLLAFMLFLGVVPYWSPTNLNSASAASVEGYDNSLAHVLAVLLSLVGLVAFALLQRLGQTQQKDRTSGTDSHTTIVLPTAGRIRILEIAAVFAVFIGLYFPFFLSKYGPYIEDSYFLTVLHRMHAGQRPYVDFETLYGPLMLYTMHFWTRITGYSMTSYYALLALMEAGFFAVLIAMLQRYYTDFRVRLGVFFLLGVFLFNTLLGLSWNGFRRFLPTLILLMVAVDPKSKRRVLQTGLLLGVLFAYSHEFGAITLAAILAIYGLMAFRKQNFNQLLPALAISAISFAVWVACSVLLLGSDTPVYFRSALYGASRFATEASFPFRWTINSVVTFGFFCLALAVVGRGLGNWAETRIVSGDYFLFGGVAYALVGLKSGLNRADMWHLATPMLVLICAFLLPLPRNLFAFSRRVHRLALVLLVVMAGTYLAALTPSGSYYARGLVLGLRDSITSQSSQQIQVVTRAPTIEPERSNPDSDVLELARYLVNPESVARPVVFYGRLWGLDKRIGVYKTVYPTDDFLLSDKFGYEVRDYLREYEDALVIMERPMFDHIFDTDQDAPPTKVYPATPTKKILGWLSTIHFVAAEIENVEKAKRWERTVGSFIRSHYHSVAEFGRLIVLERKR